MTYFNEVTNPKKGLVIKILLRPKGIILCTEEYDCFLFKNNSKALELYQVFELFKEHPDIQKEFWVHPNKKKKIGFEILFGNPIKWFFQDETISLEPPEGKETEDLLNQLKPLLAILPKDEEEAVKKGKKRNTGGGYSN